MDKSKSLLLALLIFFTSITIAPAPPQSHPLSEIAPVDTDLNMSNYRVENVSQLQLNDGIGSKGLLLEGYSISGEGQAQELVLDYQNDEWDIENSDLNLNDNIITGVNQINAENGRNLQIMTDGSGGFVTLYDQANSQQILSANEGGNVEIPNGDLDVSGQLSVGSTQCASGEALLGDGSCGATSDPQSLSDVLSQGASTGGTNIDMDGANLSDNSQGNVTVGQDLKVYGKVWTPGDGGGSGSDITGSQNLSQVLTEGSVANQSIDMDGSTIENIATPTASNDAMTKGYADSNYLNRDGTDYMQGNFDLNGYNITDNAEGNVTISQDLKIDGQLWLPGDASGGSGSASGLADVLNENNSAGGQNIDMDNGTIRTGGSGYNRISQISDTGVYSGHNNLELRTYYGPDNDWITDIRTQYGDVEIPNGNLDMSGNSIVSSTTGNVTIGQDLAVDGNIWTNGADLAEVYSSEQNLGKGAVVAIDTDREDSVERTSKKYQETVTGVVSTDPSHVMNQEESGHPIALEGKVPVKVSEENGEIEIGDRVAPASENGKAMRCEIRSLNETETFDDYKQVSEENRKCRDSTIGRALENSDGKSEMLVKLS
jgi:hypothetical protein